MADYLITAKSWAVYRDKLASISETAAQLMQEYVNAHGFEINQEFIDYAYFLTTKYGEAAGALTADFYDEMVDYWAQVEEGKEPWKAPKSAEVAETATRDEIASAMFNSTEATAPGIVHRYVKQVSADTLAKKMQSATVQNGRGFLGQAKRVRFVLCLLHKDGRRQVRKC